MTKSAPSNPGTSEDLDLTQSVILIVDDNAQNVELLQAYLEALPCRTITAPDGIEGPFALDDPEAVEGGLSGARAVLHCAGPFFRTAGPMAQACVRARCHYLDVTGEISVFQALHAMGPDAERAGVMLLPGVGFDVVEVATPEAAWKEIGSTRARTAFLGAATAEAGEKGIPPAGVNPGSHSI